MFICVHLWFPFAFAATPQFVDVAEDAGLSTVTWCGGPEGTFTNVSTSFTTAPVADPRAGGSLKIRILHNHLGTGAREVEIDNIRLDATTVPEPATAALGMLTGAGLATRRTRRH